MADGPLRAAINGAISNFGNLGGAHATAEQKAAAQKAELLRWLIWHLDRSVKR
jgi:hypothetical protein